MGGITTGRNPEPRRRRPGSDATLLLALGFVLFASGIALVVAPQYSQRATEVADVLARFAGLQSGVLLLGGLVFFSLGVLGRTIQRTNSAPRFTPSRPSREESGDASRGVERLAGDVAQLRALVEQSSATLQHALQEALGQIQGQQAPPGAEQQPLDGDPLFKLAGSLDHMNARLDERMNAVTERLDQLLEARGSGAGARGGSPPASGAGGVEPLQMLVDRENDPEATEPSEFFDGVEDLAAPKKKKATTKKSGSSKPQRKKSSGDSKK